MVFSCAKMYCMNCMSCIYDVDGNPQSQIYMQHVSKVGAINMTWRVFLWCAGIGALCAIIALAICLFISPALGTISGIIAALLLSGIAAHSIRKRMQQLQAAVQGCMAGELQHIPGARAGDELDQVCDALCAMLRDAQQERKHRRQIEEKLNALLTLAKRFHSALRWEQDMEALLRVVRQAAGADGCVMLRYDARNDAFNIRAKDGITPLADDIKDGRTGDAPWRLFLNRSEPLIVRHDSDDRLATSPFSHPLPYDVIIVPLRMGEQLVGILALTKDGDGFSHDEYEIAITGGYLLTVALQNTALQERLTNLFIETVTALAEAVDAKDPYTRHHSRWVTECAVAFGRWLNLTPSEIDALHIGGLMHDIGKIAIPDQILRKPGALTPEEREVIKQHPMRGAEILAHVSFPWDVLPIVKYHHERWDGKGYPEGLRGEEIPFLARIVAIADAFHAMISDRAYRPALALDEAVRRIWAEAGKQFDPNLVPSFAKMVEAQSIPMKLNEWS